VSGYEPRRSSRRCRWRILGPALPVQALRSLKEPGRAFEFDDQPAHMDHYVDLPDDGDPRHDNGGVHINSGIPNHAFFLVATALGGNAWEKAGSIWYRTLTERLNEDSDFQEAAEATVAVSATMFGAGGPEEEAVRSAWEQVGIKTSA
jgi:Zn-dependent metalloprotease